MGHTTTAQRSIRTGTDALEMAASNTRVFGTSIGAFGRGSAVLHFPHCVGRSSIAYFSRFVVPHEPHAINMPLSSSFIVKPPPARHTPGSDEATQMPARTDFHISDTIFGTVSAWAGRVADEWAGKRGHGQMSDDKASRRFRRASEGSAIDRRADGPAPHASAGWPVRRQRRRVAAARL